MLTRGAHESGNGVSVFDMSFETGQADTGSDLGTGKNTAILIVTSSRLGSERITIQAIEIGDSAFFGVASLLLGIAMRFAALAAATLLENRMSVSSALRTAATIGRARGPEAP